MEWARARFFHYHCSAFTKKTSCYGGLFLKSKQFPQLADCVLEGLAGLEGRDLHRGDGDLLCRVPRVHTDAGLALGNAVRAEAGDGDVVTFLQLLRDGGDEGLEGVGRGALGDACGIRNRGNEFLLGHGGWG